MYIEEVINEVNIKSDIRIQSETMSMIRFADDIAMVAEREENLRVVKKNRKHTETQLQNRIKYKDEHRGM